MNAHKAKRRAQGLTLRAYCLKYGVEPTEQSRLEHEGEPPKRLVDLLPPFLPTGTSAAQMDALVEELRAQGLVLPEESDPGVPATALGEGAENA